MTRWRKAPQLLLSLLLLAGPPVFAPQSAAARNPLAPLASLATEDEDDDPTSTPDDDPSLAIDAAEHAGRAPGWLAPPQRPPVLLPARRHHAPPPPLTAPAPFRAALNPPRHC
jgi:hypothetical protein